MRVSVLFFLVFLLILASGTRAQISVLAPSPNSPINTSSGVIGSLQCTKSSDDTYAVCASKSNTAIKYNLEPFSFAAKGPNQGDRLISCDLYETSSQSTSRAVCVKGDAGTNGIVYFHNISDMSNVTNVTIGIGGYYLHVIVDTPNQVVYVSNDYNNPPAIYKITNIGSSSPVFAGNLTSFGFGDNYPVAMLIVDGFLYVHFNTNPAHLARINISSFTWNQTVNFTSGEIGHVYDNLANDDNFIYDLTENGILVRCTYRNNNFTRLDSLIIGYGATYSLAISPDQRTLFLASQGNSLLQMVATASFSTFGDSPAIASAFGRPIITRWCNVYSFSSASNNVSAFRLNSSVCRTPSAELSASPTGSISAEPSTTRSSSKSASRTITSSITSSLTVSNSSGIATSSSSRHTHSISVSHSKTKSLELTPSPPNISLSSSSSVSRIKSSSFSLSQSASAIVPPPPYISPLREVYETVATTSSLVSLASMSSANVLGAARARSALGQFSDIVAGTCSIDADSLSDLENSPPEVSDSPTQLKLGGNYLTGQAMGNLVVIVGVGALWMFGYVVITGRSNTDETKEENHRKNKKHVKKKNERKKDKKSFAEIIIASNAHGMTLFVVSLLLEPTLSSSAMSLIGEIFVEGRTITVLSVVCVVLSWLVLLVVGMGWSIWKLIYVRDFDDDEFELLQDKKEENDAGSKDKFWFRRFVEYTTSPFGEWEFKGHRKKEKILFELARPFVDSFTDKWPKFIVVDLGVIVLLSLTTIVPAMIPNESGACTIQGVALCLALGLHVLLVVYKRPVYTDRMSNTLGCVVDILSIAAVAGAMSLDENDVGQVEHFSRVALVQSIGQMTMSVLQIIEVLFPLWDGGVDLVKKFFSSKSIKKRNVVDDDHSGNGNSQHDLADLLLQEMKLIPSLRERKKKTGATKNSEKEIVPTKKRKLTFPDKNKVFLPQEYYDDL